MKLKITALIMLCYIILLFSSCESSFQKELNERLIIEAIGIDFAEYGYKISVQALNTSSLPTGEESGGSPVTYFFTAEAKTVGDALAQIAVKSGKLPLYSQARILLLGRKVAEEGLADILDFFTREYTTRNDILFAVAEKTAEEIIASKSSSAPSADIIESQLLVGKNNGLATATELYSFINSVLSESDCAACAVLSTGKEENGQQGEKKEEEGQQGEKKEEDEQPDIKITGTILFYDVNPVCFLTPEETQIFLLLTNQTKDSVISLNSNGINCVLQTISAKTKIKTTEAHNGIKFYISLKLVCDITEFENGIKHGITVNDLQNLKQNAADMLCKKTAEVIKRTFFENDCDICRFGRRLLHKNRSSYNSIFTSESINTEKISCEIKTDFSIRRIGKEIAED